MQHDFLDRYSRTTSVIHRQRTGFKLLIAILLLLAGIMSPLQAAWVHLAIALFLVSVVWLSRLPWPFVLRRLLFLEPFALGIALLALLQPHGGQIFLGLMLRANLGLLTVIVLTNTTPFEEILRVLKRLRVPGLLVTTLALMYRYLFILIDEAERMERARRARTFSSKQRTIWSLSSIVIGQLFVRSSERAERIYAAMCARGWRI